jgi:hypothetical protein
VVAQVRFAERRRGQVEVPIAETTDGVPGQRADGGEIAGIDPAPASGERVRGAVISQAVGAVLSGRHACHQRGSSRTRRRP